MRHFYWAVTSTEESLHCGKLKLAKFQSFLSHVINKHKNLPSRVFEACAHGNITKPKVWMSKGTNKDMCKPSRDTIKVFASEFLKACISVNIFLFDSLLCGE